MVDRASIWALAEGVVIGAVTGTTGTTITSCRTHGLLGSEGAFARPRFFPSTIRHEPFDLGRVVVSLQEAWRRQP
jgi:hypothetical protein